MLRNVCKLTDRLGNSDGLVEKRNIPVDVVLNDQRRAEISLHDIFDQIEVCKPCSSSSMFGMSDVLRGERLKCMDEFFSDEWLRGYFHVETCVRGGS